MAKATPSILYLYPTPSSFVKKDIRFLSKGYSVKSPTHTWNNKWLVPLRFLQQFIFLSRHIFSCQAVFVMFGGYWSFLPALFGKIANKPVYIILGGMDCVSFPTLHYGNLRKPVLAMFIKWSYQLSTTLIPVDESLVYCEYKYYDASRYKYQGYKYHFPRITTPYKVIHNGFDSSAFKPSGTKKIGNSFIAVALIPNMMRFKLKGADIVVMLAQHFRHCTFTIVGISKSVIDQAGAIPENLQFLPPLPQDQLSATLSQNEFVLQLSISEGFPNSLCEAMLCGCIPIGSSAGAIPHIISDTGYVMESADEESIKRKFQDIVELSGEKKMDLAARARNRVIDNFDISRREKSFGELLMR